MKDTSACFFLAPLRSQEKNGPTSRGHFLLEAGHSRSVTAAHMLDHDLAAPLFADRHVTTGSVSIVAPIVAMTIAPIVRPVIISTFTVTPAVGSDAQVQLSNRDRGLGRDIHFIPGGCRQNPRRARDGGNKRKFSHSHFLLCRRHYEVTSTKRLRARSCGNGHLNPPKSPYLFG